MCELNHAPTNSIYIFIGESDSEEELPPIPLSPSKKKIKLDSNAMTKVVSVRLMSFFFDG